MRRRNLLLGVMVFGPTMFLISCANHRPDDAAHFHTGESVVLAGEEPAKLAFAPLLSKPINVRNTYRDGLPQTVHYVPGRDYLFDASGQIQRTAESRIPDFRTNILYGKEDFNHSQFPGFGNGAFFVYVDYSHREKCQPVPQITQLNASCLPITRKQLRAGEKVRIVAYGDSITAGGDASEPGMIFWERWAEALRKKYPQAKVETINGATGGDSTVQGLQRLQAKVLSPNPNLVLVGFGMNDHNRGGVPPDDFAENLRTMIDRIRANTCAEIVLFSAFPPNPKWHYGTHNMEAYAVTTEQVAREKHCAFADVYHLWMDIATRKRPEDLLGNNINHPNDFGHWIFFQALQAIEL